MAKMEVLHLTPSERGELEAYLRKRNLPASVAQRMRIVLLLDESTSYRDIEEKLGAAPSTISRWKQRHEQDGVLGLATIHPGQPPQKLPPSVAGQGVGANPASSSRWINAMVVAEDGGGDEGQQESDRAHLEGGGSEAASAGTLYGFQRSSI